MVPIKELVQTNYFILLYLFVFKTGLALQSKSSLGLNLWDLCDAKLLQVMSPANSIKAETDIELPAAGQRGRLTDIELTAAEQRGRLTDIELPAAGQRGRQTDIELPAAVQRGRLTDIPAAGQRGSGLQDCLLTETKHST